MRKYFPTTFLMLFKKNLRATRNVAIDRIEFVQCHQHQGETFDSFYIRLRRLSDCSDLCHHCIDTQLTTHIINGINNPDARKRLLELTPFPTLQRALLVCRSIENTQRNVSLLRDIKHVNKITTTTEKKDNKTSEICYRCGNKRHKFNQPCPAQGVICHGFGKANHFFSVCRSVKRNASKTTGNAKIGSIRVLHISTNRRAPTIKVDFLNDDNKYIASTTATPDCGAEATVAGVEILSILGKLRHNLTRGCKETLVAANGELLTPIGNSPRIPRCGSSASRLV